MARVTVPAFAEGFLADVIEYHSDKLLRGCEQDFTSHWESLNYFWKLYTGTFVASAAGTTHNQQQRERSKHGRICNRRRMAQIIVVCSHGDGGDGAAMSDWSPEQWQSLKSLLDTLRKSMIRADAHEPLTDVSDENCATDTRRLRHPLFAKKYDKLVDILVVNELVSRVRHPIERQLESKSSIRSCTSNNDQEEQVGQEHIIPQADLQTFAQTVDAMENQRVRNFLAQFLRPKTLSTSNELCLTPVEDLRQAMESDACNLEKVQAKITSLVRDWCALVFKERVPVLKRLGYGEAFASNTINYESMIRKIPKGRAPDKEAAGNNPSFRQQSDRHALPRRDKGGESVVGDHPTQKSTVDARHIPSNYLQKYQDRLRIMGAARRNLEISFEDPLPETIAAAEHAVTRKRRNNTDNTTLEEADGNQSLNLIHARPSHHIIRRNHPGIERNVNKRRKSAHAIRFDDSEDDDYEIVISPVKLSELPAAKSWSNRTDLKDSWPSGGKAQVPATKVASSVGASGKRKRFTDEEKRAILKGVERHGVGNWATIKADFATVLRSRTNVQIKDCHRTMKKNGEI